MYALLGCSRRNILRKKNYTFFWSFFRGNPDKCDFLGNTALHCAAINGHMSCVTFLVSFGANIWALDNDFHTPLDVAVLNDHKETVKYLDAVAAKQSTLNKKVVKKLREKASVDAHKRVKKYSKLQDKANKKAELEDKKLAKEREKMGIVGTIEPDGYDSGRSTMRSSKFSTISASSGIVNGELKPFSAYVNQNKKATTLGGVAKKIKQRQKNGYVDSVGEFKVCELEWDGTKTIKSLSGLQRDAQILYVKSEKQKNGVKNGHDDVISRVNSEPDFNYSADSGVESADSPEAASMFECPGFGNVAFMCKNGFTGALLMSLPSDCTDDDTQSSEPPDDALPGTSNGHSRSRRRRGSLTDSIGTLGSLAARMRDVPWDENDLENLDDEDINESTPLELFLAANGVSEYLSLLTQEKIDLPALMLLNDSDLKEIGMPMGPRRKILDGVSKRKQTMYCPGIMMDTIL